MFYGGGEGEEMPPKGNMSELLSSAKIRLKNSFERSLGT